jgi:hypothetical protein
MRKLDFWHGPRSRQGQFEMTFDLAWAIPRMMLIVYVTVCIVMLARHFLVQNVDVAEAESKILANRFLFSPQCLAYRDPRQSRVEVGMIDASAFTSYNLNRCANFSVSNDFAAAKLTLTLLYTDEVREVYFNQDGYDAWLPRVGFLGPGGARLHTEWRYVLVRDSATDAARKALLTIEVLTPNY